MIDGFQKSSWHSRGGLPVIAALTLVAGRGLCPDVGALIAWRTGVCARLHRLAMAGHFDERIAVYGAGPIAARVEAYIREQRDGLCFVGAFDDRADRTRLRDVDVAIAASLADLIEAGREGHVDRIIVALPQAADRRLHQIASAL